MRQFVADMRAWWHDAGDWRGRAIIVAVFPLIVIAYWFAAFLDSE